MTLLSVREEEGETHFRVSDMSMEEGKDACPCLLILPSYSLASTSSTTLELFSSKSLILADAAINFSATFDTVVHSLLHENFLGFPYSTIY